MNILVTGGSGFIGSNFIRYMLEKYPDYNIFNLDTLTYAGNPDNLKDIENKSHYSFIQGDICDKTIVEKAMQKMEYVVLFAAESHVDRSIEDGFTFFKTNSLGTYTLLNHALNFNIKRFIHISADEVYDSIMEGSFNETDRLTPSSPCASSKAGSDLLVYSYCLTHKLPIIITRCTNNFGPYQHPEKLVPLFITNLLQNRNIPVYGTGKNIRDWIYVLDHCKAVDFVLHNGKIDEIYTIARGNGTGEMPERLNHCS